MKQLNDMTLEELWELFPIILTAPDKRWEQWAKEEIYFLNSILDESCVEIHHIGSTAIKGIWAKPIIDLIAVAKDFSYFPALKSKIISAGYLCMSESEKRISFNKGYTLKGFAQRVFHLHLRVAGDADEIYFRNYLNAHPNVAKEYETLKLSLWRQFEYNRDGYTKAKSSFIKHYTEISKDLNLK